MPEDKIISRALNRANLIKNGNVQVENSTIINEDFIEGLIHALEWVLGEITDEGFMLYPRGSQDEEDEVEFDPDDYDPEDEEEYDENDWDLTGIDPGSEGLDEDA